MKVGDTVILVRPDKYDKSRGLKINDVGIIVAMPYEFKGEGARVWFPANSPEPYAKPEMETLMWKSQLEVSE